MATCTSRDCNTEAELKGLCKRCYHREYMRIRRQDPDVKKQDAESTRKYLQTKEGKAKRKAYRQRPEVKAKEAEQAKKWRANNKEYIAEIGKKWRQENPERVKELKRNWNKTPQGKKYSREKARKEREEHPERAKHREQKYRDSHKEETKLRGKIWREENPHKNAEKSRRYFARKNERQPPWIEDYKEEVLVFYAEAKKLEEKDGIKRHVDHIYPLKGKRSSGLHVPWNLQILTAEENLRKQAKEPEIK